MKGVLENVLVCAQFYTKLAHGIQSVCYITQLFRFFWNTLDFSILCPNCALVLLLSLVLNTQYIIEKQGYLYHFWGP